MASKGPFQPKACYDSVILPPRISLFPRVMLYAGSEFGVKQYSYSRFESWFWCLKAVLLPRDMS